jgi:hypothetical protein
MPQEDFSPKDPGAGSGTAHVTFHPMKTPKKGQSASIITPLLAELADRAKANFQILNASISEMPSQPASLYEDAGGGYNSNYVFPQA